MTKKFEKKNNEIEIHTREAKATGLRSASLFKIAIIFYLYIIIIK